MTSKELYQPYIRQMAIVICEIDFIVRDAHSNSDNQSCLAKVEMLGKIFEFWQKQLKENTSPFDYGEALAEMWQLIPEVSKLKVA